MTARTLLDTLEGLGVQVTITPAGKLQLEPASLVPAALLVEIKARKAEVLVTLQAPTVPSLAPLPEPLVRLVNAAAGNHLQRLAQLPNGIVTDLGEYVLTSAAKYAACCDPERQLTDLWACYRAWNHHK